MSGGMISPSSVWTRVASKPSSRFRPTMPSTSSVTNENTFSRTSAPSSTLSRSEYSTARCSLMTSSNSTSRLRMSKL